MTARVWTSRLSHSQRAPSRRSNNSNSRRSNKNRAPAQQSVLLALIQWLLTVLLTLLRLLLAHALLTPPPPPQTWQLAMVVLRQVVVAVLVAVVMLLQPQLTKQSSWLNPPPTSQQTCRCRLHTYRRPAACAFLTMDSLVGRAGSALLWFAFRAGTLCSWVDSSPAGASTHSTDREALQVPCQSLTFFPWSCRVPKFDRWCSGI